MRQMIFFIGLIVADMGFSFRNALAIGKKADISTVESFKDDVYPKLDKKVDKTELNRTMDKIEISMTAIQEEQRSMGESLATLTERTKWIKEWKDKNGNNK